MHLNAFPLEHHISLDMVAAYDEIFVGWVQDVQHAEIYANFTWYHGFELQRLLILDVR